MTRKTRSNRGRALGVPARGSARPGAPWRTPRSRAPISRRDLLQGVLLGLGSAAIGFPRMGRASAPAAEARSERTAHGAERVLVVVELAGGNDGLNTVVPYRSDVYRSRRPRLALGADVLHRLDDERGLHPALRGLASHWERGELALVEGCGYPNPVRSHFSAQEFWHTARPHAAEPYGWIGRFLDQVSDPDPLAAVAIGVSPPRAVAAASHSAVCFGDPQQFERRAPSIQRETYGELLTNQGSPSAGRDPAAFVRQVARLARSASKRVQDAVASYSTPVSYGVQSDAASLGRDLRRVAALIAAEFPTLVYHVSTSGFDTHANQLQIHQTQLGYVDDALRGFHQDLVRLGRARDVVVLVFTEFGRRLAENRSGGTDHGTATPVFVLGEPVRGGLFGAPADLSRLDSAGDPAPTTDFRRVYAALLRDWLAVPDPSVVLGIGFEPLAFLERTKTA